VQARFLHAELGRMGLLGEQSFFLHGLREARGIELDQLRLLPAQQRPQPREVAPGRVKACLRDDIEELGSP
jgi:hypothetical protein